MWFITMIATSDRHQIIALANLNFGMVNHTSNGGESENLSLHAYYGLFIRIV